LNVDYKAEPSGAVITRLVEAGFGMDTRLNGFLQFRYIDDRTRAIDRVIGRKQFGYILQFSPSRRLTSAGLSGALGEDIDFDNARPARGATVNTSATMQPTDHLELALVENVRFLNVADGAAASARLFTQQVSRIKGTYTFTSRMFVRAIGQYVATRRDPLLYLTAVDCRSGQFSGSALFAYKVNLQ